MNPHAAATATAVASPRTRPAVRLLSALTLALAVATPLLTAALPTHKLSDGCPLCVNGGALSADGLPAYDIGAEASVVPPAAPISASSGASGSAPKSGPATSASASALAPAPAPAQPPSPAALAASVAAVTAPGAAQPFPKIGKDAAGLPRIGFEHLASFTYTPPPETAAPTPGSTARLPAEVRALNGQRVSLTGYMLPTRLEKGLAVEFFIVRTAAMCCYGVTPQPHEWVAVKMKGKGLVPLSDVPLHFTGTLHVGEIYEGGAFVGFYRLDGESVSVK